MLLPTDTPVNRCSGSRTLPPFPTPSSTTRQAAAFWCVEHDGDTSRCVTDGSNPHRQPAVRTRFHIVLRPIVNFLLAAGHSTHDDRASFPAGGALCARVKTQPLPSKSLNEHPAAINTLHVFLQISEFKFDCLRVACIHEVSSPCVSRPYGLKNSFSFRRIIW
ncbi:hypothetical protein B0H13DRAFT_2081024 [Mycena leptocephala]|nr:hypothetical protein B0H13DRAFT_2081024 [Mycena leptocephala]